MLETREPGVAVIATTPRRSVSIAVLVLLAAGIVLRVVQLLANRSLWIDEAALALNLIHKSARELAGPLAHGQMAPIAFLWLEKAVASVFGYGEWSLRLVPFAAGLIALVLFARVARETLEIPGTLVAVGLFALNHRLIYYSSEVKQYETDAAVSVALLGIAIVLRAPRSRSVVAAMAVLGTLGGWLSEPACYVLAGVGASLLVSAWRRRDRRLAMRAAGLGLWWLATVVPVLRLEQRNLTSADSKILTRYWSDGLPSTALGVGRWLRTVVERDLLYLFELSQFGTRVRQLTMLVLLAVLVLGAAVLARRAADTFVLCAVPLALALGGAAASLYPLSRRLTLYLLPMLLLLAGAGVDAVRRRLGSLSAAGLGIALVAVPAARTLTVVPEHQEELRPVLTEVAARATPDDAVYVHYGAVRAFEYYAPRLRLPPRDVVLGCCHLDQWQEEIAAIRRLAPRPRIWFVFSHFQPGEPEFFAAALDRFGRRLAAVESHGAAAYLYALHPVDDAAVAEVLSRAPAERVRTELNWECVAGILYVAPCGPR